VSLAKKARCSAPAIFVETTEPENPKGAAHRNTSKNNYIGAMHLKNPGIVKIPTNPDSYRDRGAAAGSCVLKVSPFRRGETFFNP
jgi:hypothetical protein